MLRILSVLWGVAFITLGVAGWIPQAMENDLLLGLFTVDNTINCMHVAVGILALVACYFGAGMVKFYFLLLGLLAALLAVFGFYAGGAMLFGVLHTSFANAALYLGTAVVALAMSSLPRHR